jgi:hypothetical protein
MHATIVEQVFDGKESSESVRNVMNRTPVRDGERRRIGWAGSEP